MTFNEARKLKPNKSFIWYAGARYRFVRLQKTLGIWMVVIEDEPQHTDCLLLSSCSLEKEKA